jgi:hypothetical protein
MNLGNIFNFVYNGEQKAEYAGTLLGSQHADQNNTNKIKKEIIVLERYFSISEMASIHGVSRQTLIYYDKIELFQPVHIDENGYRFYAAEQIPFLREICFLKSIGIKLNDIKSISGTAT